MYTPIRQNSTTKSHKNNDIKSNDAMLANKTLSHEQQKVTLNDDFLGYNIKLPLTGYTKKSSKFLKLSKEPTVRSPGIPLVSHNV